MRNRNNVIGHEFGRKLSDMYGEKAKDLRGQTKPKKLRQGDFARATGLTHLNIHSIEKKGLRTLGKFLALSRYAIKENLDFDLDPTNEIFMEYARRRRILECQSGISSLPEVDEVIELPSLVEEIKLTEATNLQEFYTQVINGTLAAIGAMRQGEYTQDMLFEEAGADRKSLGKMARPGYLETSITELARIQLLARMSGIKGTLNPPKELLMIADLNMSQARRS